MNTHIPWSAPEERGQAWGRGGRGLRHVAASLAVVMSVSVLMGAEGALAAPTGAKTADKKPVKPAPSSAVDIPSARVTAKLYGKRVEALSERTETSTTWANPNGSLTTELTAGPTRFRDGASSEWRVVDLDLVKNADGSVEPKAHPNGLELAKPGGTRLTALSQNSKAAPRDLVTLGEGDQQITLQWKGGLPAPKLDGTRATYVNAVPHGDIVVEATRTGFEQFVEIKQRPTADAYSYTLPLKTKGLKVKQLKDGSLLFIDKKSKKRASMPMPVMWDASVDKVSGEHNNRAKVGLKVVKTKGGVDLVITPDAKFLSDPETKYPVVVDPSTSSLSNVFDTYVQQGETVDWSADTELDLGNPGTTNSDGTPRTARSFVSWNTSPIQDALVSEAKLSLWNFHSGNTDCKAYPWEVWSTGAASTSSRWTAQPAWTAKKATSTETKGNPSCTSAPDGWVTADVSTLAQEWASAKATRGHMGLRATSETVTAQWKRVNSANAASNPPKLVVTYNYRPRTGTKQEAGPPYFSYSGAYTVSTVTPVLRDTFVDANGDKVNGTFQIFDNATNTQVGDVIVSKYVPSGQVASVTVPAGVLVDGKTYKFRTSPFDGEHYNVGWSPWKTFTVDTKAPAAPTKVTSTDYPSNSWVKGAGQKGTFSVTPPASDHNWLEWSLDGVSWTKVSTGGSSAAKDISITPESDGTHTLQVRAVDKADNKSEEVEYAFHAGPGGFVQPSDGERTARRLPLNAEADGSKYDSVSFSWRRSEADPWVKIPVADVTSAGASLAAWPVALTNGNNSGLVWNATDTVDPDGSVEIKADFTGPSSAAGSTDPLTVVVDRNGDTAAPEDIGPGTLNMLTGDFSIPETDISVFGLSADRTASSRNPDAGVRQEGQAPIFGKEWVSGTAVSTTESEYSHVRKVTATAVDVAVADGTAIHFTANAGKTGWVPEPGSESLTLKGSTTGVFTLTDSEGTTTEFTKPSADADTWQVSTTEQGGLADSATTIVSETVTVGDKKLARPTRIYAPAAGATLSQCKADPATKGCRVLEYVYADATTATATEVGDFTGQVRELRLWSTNPGAANAAARTVQVYRYGMDGRLRQAWDPRISPALKTEYAYDSDGRVTKVTPSGELPWTFTYGKAGASSAAGQGMLLKSSRPALKEGTTDVVEGEAVTSVVYDVPLSGASAPYSMGASSVKSWGQLTVPTDATAIFAADVVPTGHSGDALASGDYRRGELYYLDASGRLVNRVSPGGHTTTTEFDRQGNVVRQLSAANRALALGLTADDKTAQAYLGIAQLPSAERADLLTAHSVYSEDGNRQLEQLGPLHRVDLTADAKSGSTTVVSAGTSVTARSRTVNQYDSGRPTDGTATVRDQITRTTITAELREHPGVQAEARASEMTYDWVKGLPVKAVQDPGGLAITTATQYDDQGRVTKQLQPGATGTDTATRVTAYWSATGTGACAGRPEWAGQICSTGPAGAITGGGSNPTELPVSTYEYDMWGQPAKVTETANGTSRTTVTSYDAAGRPTSVKTTGGLGQAVPETTTEYDAATGMAVKVVSVGGGTITKQYDKLGRPAEYIDADGGKTTTAYDLLDRPTKVTDSVPSTTTYTYDHAAEPRGMATRTTDSVAGAFSAVYDANGAVSSQQMPGGYTLKQTSEADGSPVSMAFTRDSDGTIVATDSVTKSVHNQVTEHAGWSDQSYAYDAIGRLTEVKDTAGTVCTRRTYAFDKRTNRTSLTTASAAAGLDCPTTDGTTTTSAYDSGDRIVDTGYAYDALGRTTAVPRNGTIGYYANDLVHQQTVNGKRQTWQLDAGQRIRSWKTETQSGSTWTQTEGKTNHYGSDGDSPRWISEDAAGAVTRNVTDATGKLAATTTKTGGVVLHVTNLHGDVALQLPLDTSKAPVALDSDEYGNPRANQPGTRYQWLGGEQRSAQTPGALTLMGVRLYNPQSGRFLSVDPIYGGSCNAYDYVCADPQNKFDLSGTAMMERVQKRCTYYTCTRIRRVCDTKSHKCGVNWEFWFRKSWAKAWIYAGFSWSVSVRGSRVSSSNYSHGEPGSYHFHGYWGGNGGRGKYKCGWWTCYLDPGDSVQFKADGVARIGGTRYYWQIYQSFPGGGKYRR